MTYFVGGGPVKPLDNLCYLAVATLGKSRGSLFDVSMKFPFDLRLSVSHRTVCPGSRSHFWCRGQAFLGYTSQTNQKLPPRRGSAMHAKLCNLFVLLILMLPVNATPTNPSVIELSKAQRIESAALGEAGRPSTIFAAYDTLLRSVATVDKNDLLWLKSHGKPAARVYAAYLLYKKDPVVGRHALLELLDDDTEIEAQSGCEVFKTSVSVVGGSLVTTGQWDGTVGRNSAAGESIYVSELMKAPMFADSTGGESGRYLEWLVFQAARTNARSLNPVDLNKILASGTPAGRLYAAILQDASGKFPKHAGFGKLATDSSKVTYATGCKRMETTVGEVAKALKEKGQFLNFRI